MAMIPGFLGFLALLTAASFIVMGTVSALRRKQPRPTPPPQLAARVAAELDVLDQRFAAGQLSPADYAAERNKLLGLPAPEQR